MKYCVNQQNRCMIKFAVTIISLFLFSACNKDNQTESAVKGQWKWFKSQAWTTVTPQSSGKTWELTLNADFSCSQSGTLFPLQSGHYTLVNDSIYINFTGNNFTTRFRYFFGSTDTLHLDSGAPADAPVHSLERMQ